MSMIIFILVVLKSFKLFILYLLIGMAIYNIYLEIGYFWVFCFIKVI